MTNFARLLHADGPNPEHATALQLYGRFVGNWDAEITAHGPDGTKHTAPGEIHFGWVLEGRAVQDVWIIPRPAGDMLIACLYAQWQDPKDGTQLLSFAAITDEPPAEVAAAGHDRMIINLKPENLDVWLKPQGHAVAELDEILADRQAPYYEHEVMAA